MSSTTPRKLIPDDVLDKMIADYGPDCPLSWLAGRYGYSYHVIHRNFTRRGVRILGHTEILKGRVAAKLAGAGAGARYDAGENANTLAVEFGVAPDAFRVWLRENGHTIRGRSAASKVRYVHATREERMARSAAMRANRPDMLTDEILEAIAAGREGKPGTNWRAAHQDLSRTLTRAGYEVTMQKAVTRYNMPACTPRVAFNLTTSGPGWLVAHRPERIRAFMQAGLDVVTVCAGTLTFPLRPASMDQVMRHLEWRDANPGHEPVYVAVTRHGETLPALALADVPDLPPVSARESRVRWAQVKAANSAADSEPAGSSSH